MFTDQVLTVQNGQEEKDGKKLLTHVEGVDVRGYQCYALNADDPVYDNFNKSNIHYAISAMQKGVKPPTKIGLKRLQKRALDKKLGKGHRVAVKFGPSKFGRRLHPVRTVINKLQEQTQELKAKPLNPLSTEQLCLKSLRTKFRQQMEKKKQAIEKAFGNEQQQLKIFEKKIQRQQRLKNRKAKFIRKKESQRQRRAELTYLVTQYGQILKNIFPAERLQGFNYPSKCPKISRQQIKDALTKYFQNQSQLFQSQQKVTELVNKKIQQRKKKQQERMARIRNRVYNNVDSEDQSSSSSSPSGSSSSSSERKSESQSDPRKLVKLD